MKHLDVKEVDLNPNYLISKNIDRIDFMDNFQLTSKRLNYLPEPQDVMIAFFKSFPKFFVFLLHTREFIAKFLNLKTAPKTKKETRIEQLHNFKGEIGDCLALFEVIDRSPIELLTGQNDSHLDFNLSFISYQKATDVTIELATTAMINNRIGKAYFTLIKPIHKFYLKRILRRMENELINKCW